MKNRKKLTIILLMNLVFSVQALSQNINMKVILVDFYKGVQSLPEITINPDVEKLYPLYFDDNPKPAHCYLGKYSEEVPSELVPKLNVILDGMVNKEEEKSLELYQSIKDQLNNKGFNLFMNGIAEIKNFNFEGALEILKQSIVENPNNDFAYFNIAKIMNSLGKKNEARDYMISALALNPRYNYYRIRNSYLLKLLQIKLKPLWFKPKWRITADKHEVRDMVWKYYLQAYLVFSKYSVQQLFELTNIEKKNLAVHVIAFNVLLHYAKLNDIMTDELKEIEKIRDKGYLIPFINIEVVYHFNDQLEPFSTEEINAIIKYFKDVYVD